MLYLLNCIVTTFHLFNWRRTQNTTNGPSISISNGTTFETKSETRRSHCHTWAQSLWQQTAWRKPWEQRHTNNLLDCLKWNHYNITVLKTGFNSLDYSKSWYLFPEEPSTVYRIRHSITLEVLDLVIRGCVEWYHRIRPLSHADNSVPNLLILGRLGGGQKPTS